ncbi:MAG: hypothetical protein LUD77_10910 [Clostridiales bacterium]|nr:hypothetical protein [Clostridiales bacterium]
MTADIVVNEGDVADWDGETENDWAAWVPIGKYASGYYYNGTFDGQSHTISGLYYNSSSGNYVGLFGTSSGAAIKNLVLENSYIYGSSYVGGICGFSEKSTIANCFNKSTITAVNSYAGGICGYIPSSNSVKFCCSTGTVSLDSSSTSSYVGAISGRSSASLSTCYYLEGTAAGCAEGYDGNYTTAKKPPTSLQAVRLHIF